MSMLFDEYPAPWVFDDNRSGNEGRLTVWDAEGKLVFCAGDMEDCTGGDIETAYLIAAAPALLAACEAALDDWRVNDGSLRIETIHALGAAIMLAKAGHE